MSLVIIKLREKDAEEASRFDRSALGRVAEAIGAALAERAKKAERKVARKRALKLPAPAAKKSEGWSTLKLRRAVFDRSEGRCENPRCRRRIRWHTFDLDHLLGRGRAVQSPENTWALCNGLAAAGKQGCHSAKTDGNPSRAWWLEAWLEFARPRFPGSETVALVEGQLQAERTGAELDAMRRQRAQEVDPEKCVKCGLDPTKPEHEGRQLYTCDRCGAGPLCSDCTENATHARFGMTEADEIKSADLTTRHFWRPVETRLTTIEEWAQTLPGQLGSPIEERLLVALVMVAGFDMGIGARLRVRSRAGVWEPEFQDRAHRELIWIEVQPEVDGLHPDFAVGMLLPDSMGARGASVLVECDGHEFHERTKEQARADKGRDRRFAMLGHQVLRFTGSEIYADNVMCAQEVYGVIASTVFPGHDFAELFRRRR